MKKLKMQNLEQKLGYTFKNPKLLEQALTHSSKTGDIHKNYERLEFLGDRILGVTVAETLCRVFADEPEGNLSQRFVGLVCKETVAEVMRQIGVEPFVITNNPEIRDSDNVLCDVGEALIAAIYYDNGNLAAAQDFIIRNWSTHIDRTSRPYKDSKTQLQEVVAALKLPAPQYAIIEKTGPEHEPEFVIRVLVGTEHTATGCGKSKKAAEQEAAEKMLVMLGERHV